MGRQGIILIYNEINIHPLLIITQAALPKRNESAVLAIQPHQADQPSDGMDSLKTSSTSATSGSGGGLWRTLLIWGAVVLIILILAAVAPICHYSRLRPFNFGVEAHAPSQMVQRLVGELKTFFNYYFFFFNSDRPPRGSLERERFIEELEKRGELPVIIIATVSGLITFLLLFVVILGTVCFFYKKKRKEKQLKGLQKAPSEGTVLFIFCLYYFLIFFPLVLCFIYI